MILKLIFNTSKKANFKVKERIQQDMLRIPLRGFSKTLLFDENQVNLCNFSVKIGRNVNLPFYLQNSILNKISQFHLVNTLQFYFF